MNERALVIASGHPLFAAGELNHAPYELYKGYAKALGKANAFYLGILDSPDGKGAIRQHSPNEYFWSYPAEGQTGQANFKDHIQALTELVKAIEPDLIHVHFDDRPELLEIARRASPDAALLATITGFGSLCMRAGLRSSPASGKACLGLEAPLCAVCSEGYNELWLGRRKLKHYLGFADKIITASNFLQNLYLACGVAPEIIHTIPEAQARRIPLKEAAKPLRNRFGYFGELSPGKGLEIIFLAFRSIDPEKRKEFILEVHGHGLSEQDSQFQEKMAAYCREFGGDGFLRWQGPCYADEAEEKIGGVDWVLCPGIAWENSPAIIAQAFALGRPVIASDIGGQAEKIRHNVDGLLLRPGAPLAWAEALETAVANEQLWQKLHAGITKGQTAEELAKRHLELVTAPEDPWDFY